MWKWAGLICYLIILSIYDIRTRKIPSVWMVIGGVATLAYLIYLCLCHPFSELWPEVLKSWGPGLLMLAAGRLSGKIGSGDGCILLVAGSILGSVKMMGVFMGSLFLAALTAVVLLIFRKAGKNDKMPFMPFLAAAVILLGMM
ncbi:MAG: prepilin peptidase [Lachnospiraceae bacterium]|nr:prepilin peptidase [Lachnospiraceae bacterium]MBR5508812.1 prepilin peptidase [Lachnospiraceae bacterium]